MLALPLAALLTSLSAAPAQERVPVRPRPEAPVLAEPAESTWTLEVEVRTVTVEPGSKVRKPVPGVALDLGVGLRDDAPRHTDQPALARAVTDESGLARVELAVPESWKEAKGARYWVRVEAPGHMRRSSSREFTKRAENPLDVFVYEGATLFGTILDAEGSAVAGADVWLFDPEGEELARSEDTDSLGRFAIDGRTPGPRTLHARASGRGTATLPIAELTPSLEVEAVLGGGHTLQGRVVDAAGNPVAGLTVAAVPSGHARIPSADELLKNEVRGGLFGDVARTGPNGRFVLPALCAGEYSLRASWSSLENPRKASEEQLGSEVGTALAGSSAIPVELVFSQHRVEVRVLSHDGSAVDLAAASKRAGDEPPHLELLDLVEGIADSTWSWHTCRLAGDRVVFVVEPERDYLVTWQHPSHAYVERPIHVGRGDLLVQVDLRLGPPAEPGRLSVRVLDPSGAPVRGASIDVLSLDARREIASSVKLLGMSSASMAHDGTWSTELPSGTFTVHASCEPIPGCVIPSPHPRAAHAPAHTVVSILPGVETSVDLRLEPAGHLDLRRHPSRGPYVEPPEELFESADWTRPYDTGRAQAALGGGRVALSSSTGARIDRVVFEGPCSSCDWIDWLVPGWQARCLTPIPEGRWLLAIEGEGGRIYQRWIEVEAGKATELTW